MVPQNVTLRVALTPTKALLDPTAQGFIHGVDSPYREIAGKDLVPKEKAVGLLC